MTREQKVKLIELIQEYFRDACEEDIKKYGYTMPIHELKELLIMVLFDKHAYVRKTCTLGGYHRTHVTAKNYTAEEIHAAFSAFMEMKDKKAISLTRSKKAVRISEKILWYNNILY